MGGMDDWIDLVQWPAMVVTIVAAYLVGSEDKHRRLIAFWTYLLSNMLWIAWGWHDGAWALIALQVALAAMNIRGMKKAEKPSSG